jgi:hypothetical protein
MLISFTIFFTTLFSIFRSRAAFQMENLALRQQILVLQRSARKRPKLTPEDRLLWVWVSRIWRDWRCQAVGLHRLFHSAHHPFPKLRSVTVSYKREQTRKNERLEDSNRVPRSGASCRSKGSTAGFSLDPVSSSFTSSTKPTLCCCHEPPSKLSDSIYSKKSIRLAFRIGSQTCARLPATFNPFPL